MQGSRATFHEFVRVISLVMQAGMCSDLGEAAASIKVVPLLVDLKGELRSFICGSTKRRLAMATTCGTHAHPLPTHQGPEQIIIATEAALEKLEHSYARPPYHPS